MQARVHNDKKQRAKAGAVSYLLYFLLLFTLDTSGVKISNEGCCILYVPRKFVHSL